MKKAVWLSYDLGVKGDYDSLYAYLDNQKAVECGDSVAFFNVEFTGTDSDLEKRVRKEIKESVRLSKTDRIYIVYRREDKRVGGKFLFGNRKSSPWQGYGHQEPIEDDGF